MKTEDAYWIQLMESKIPDWQNRIAQIRDRYNQLKETTRYFKNIWNELVLEYFPKTKTVSLTDWKWFVAKKTQRRDKPKNQPETNQQSIIFTPEYQWIEDDTDTVDWPAGRLIKK